VKLSTTQLTDDVPYLQATNMAFMGTNVTEGLGMGIVVSTGAQAQLAKISAQSSETVHSITGLQRELDRFVAIIACFALITTAAVIVMWAAYLNPYHPHFMAV
jgi:magnesium-transporting ATPase (P-type)